MNIIVDVESDGPCPGKEMYSMVCFGAAAITKDKEIVSFLSLPLLPISENWIPEALAISGYSREFLLKNGADPSDEMIKFHKWLKDFNAKRLVFYSDNNGYDWQFINYYFHRYLSTNPFGFSSQNIGSLYKGVVKDCFASFKHLRKTKHDHNPANDARGNAEALIKIFDSFKVNTSYK